MSHPGTIDHLSAWLRWAAARAAELAGGGCTLLFVTPPEQPDARPTLRAAAGFVSPDAARAAAAELEAPVSGFLNAGESGWLEASPALGARGAAGVSILPLRFDTRLHGVLAVGAPTALDARVAQGLGQLAASVAIHLDHAHLAAAVDELRRASPEVERPNERGDELLKLSEALFAQDIELLRNNEKLGKIEKIKNDFIEKMSRELRTPLNSIIEAIIAVLAGENESLSDQSKGSLRRALDEGTAFQRTLQNILDLWRIRQGELPVEAQELNFAEIIDETIFSVQDTLGGKPVEIEKHLEGTLPKIRTDLAKTNQILFLLLDNAAKFTQEGRIVISARVADDQLVCQIQDTGIGVCPDDQHHIFDEFFQVDELSSSRYRGAGLGLALVRDLLALLDGELSLESEAGRGTCVRFRIPVQTV